MLKSHPVLPLSLTWHEPSMSCWWLYGAFEVTGKFLISEQEELMRRQCWYQSLDFEKTSYFHTSESHREQPRNVTFSLFRSPAQVLHPRLMPGMRPAQRERHAPLLPLWACKCGEGGRGRKKNGGARGEVEEDCVGLSGEGGGGVKAQKFCPMLHLGHRGKIGDVCVWSGSQCFCKDQQQKTTSGNNMNDVLYHSIQTSTSLCLPLFRHDLNAALNRWARGFCFVLITLMGRIS